MMRRTLAYIGIAFICGSTGLASAQEVDGSVEAAIQRQMEAWISAYERGDPDVVASLYMEDAMYAANTGEVLRDRSGIRDGVRAWMEDRPPGVTLDLVTEQIRFRSVGESAHSVMRFVIRAAPLGCALDAGHSLTMWRAQEDGSWRIVTHLVNRDPEPPADACSRRTALVPDGERVAAFRAHPRYADQRFVMLNLLAFANDSARARYFTEYAMPALELIRARGGRVLWSGKVDQRFAGSASADWDHAVLVEWPSRAAFADMVSSAAYRALQSARQETLESTLVLVTTGDAAPPER